MFFCGVASVALVVCVAGGTALWAAQNNLARAGRISLRTILAASLVMWALTWRAAASVYESDLFFLLVFFGPVGLPPIVAALSAFALLRRSAQKS